MYTVYALRLNFNVCGTAKFQLRNLPKNKVSQNQVCVYLYTERSLVHQKCDWPRFIFHIFQTFLLQIIVLTSSHHNDTVKALTLSAECWIYCLQQPPMSPGAGAHDHHSNHQSFLATAAFYSHYTL